MPGTRRTLARVAKKVQSPKDLKRHSSDNIYDIYLDDPTWTAFGLSPNDSGAVIPNTTATQDALEPWESDPDYFDQFIIRDSTWATFDQSLNDLGPNNSATQGS